MFVFIYIDDGGIIGSLDAMKEVLAAFSKVFRIYILCEIKRIVGCHIIGIVDKDGICIQQTKVLKSL
jgi:hypothetical protein